MGHGTRVAYRNSKMTLPREGVHAAAGPDRAAKSVLQGPIVARRRAKNRRRNSDFRGRERIADRTPRRLPTLGNNPYVPVRN